MKKIMLFAAFAAALFTVSCNKEARLNDAPEQPALRTVTFNALPTETKTLFGDKSGTKYPVLWQEGDKICPSFNFASPSSGNYITVTPSADGSSASFKGEFAEAESYRFMFVSPAVTFKSINRTNGTVMVEFPSGQTSTAASPDPEAQILFADTGEMTEIPNPVTLNFSHLSAYLHLQFTNVDLGDAEVQAVNVTNDDYPLAGRIFYHFAEDTFEASTVFHTIAVATNTLDDVWCAVCPADFSGKQITVTVSTDKGTLTKTLTMPASAKLTRGKIAKFTVDMTGISIVAPVIYKAITSVDQLNAGDKVIIAAAGLDQPYAMSTGQNTNNRSAAGVTKTDTEIVNPIETVEIFDVEDGIIPGHYAFKATGEPGYIYAGNQASSGSNILKTKATMGNDASWAISVEDVTVGEKTWTNATRMFADIPESGRGLLRFNSSDKLFAAYGAGTSQEAIKIYRLDETAALSFNATLPDGNSISAAAQDISVYVWGNVAWTASVSGTDATLSAASGTGNAVLTLSVPENTDTQNTKSYSVTVTTSAAVATQSITLDITQAKKPNVATFPIVWSFPAIGDNWKKDVDFHLEAHSFAGSYIYSDTHQGRIYVVSTATNTSVSNPNYRAFDSSEVASGFPEGMCFIHYGMGYLAYWQFEVYNVINPAGTYNIKYQMSSSNAGPAYYRLEYTLDDNWDNPTPIEATLSAPDNYNSTTNVNYTYSTLGNNTVNDANASFHLAAVEGKTLMIRALVVSKIRANGTSAISQNSGGTNRIFGTPTITFTAD